jgi:hypothetical protein
LLICTPPYTSRGIVHSYKINARLLLGNGGDELAQSLFVNVGRLATVQN